MPFNISDFNRVSLFFLIPETKTNTIKIPMLSQTIIKNSCNKLSALPNADINKINNVDIKAGTKNLVCEKNKGINFLHKNSAIWTNVAIIKIAQTKNPCVY